MHALRKVAGLAAACLLIATVSTPAHAHAQLIEVTPQMGSSVEESPPEARLVFNEELMDFGYAVVVTQILDGTEPAPEPDSATPDNPWVSGEPEIEGPALSIPLQPDLPTGQYRVAWRVVSADGHPISGVIDFAIGQPFSAEALPVGSASSDAGGAAVSEESSTGSEQEATESSRMLRIALIALGGAAAALAVWFVIHTVRRGAAQRNEKTTS